MARRVVGHDHEMQALGAVADRESSRGKASAHWERWRIEPVRQRDVRAREAAPLASDPPWATCVLKDEPTSDLVPGNYMRVGEFELNGHARRDRCRRFGQSQPDPEPGAERQQPEQ